MIKPSSFAVFELKFLQKSMMLMPCGPSAVPTGGAGVALPAAIWSFTIAWTFLAIAFSLAANALSRRLKLLDLQEVQLDRSRSSEDGDHHFERVLVEIHVVDHAVEAGERTLVDPHLLALLEHVLRLRLLGRRPHLLQNLLDFVL